MSDCVDGRAESPVQWTAAVGDTVRVLRPKDFESWLAKKLTDRVGVVTWVWEWKIVYGNRVRVRFGKRNGRGKEFDHVFHERDLMPVSAMEVPDGSTT